MRSVFLSFTFFLLMVRGTLSDNSYCKTPKAKDDDPKIPSLQGSSLFVKLHAKILDSDLQAVTLISGYQYLDPGDKKFMMNYTTQDGHQNYIYIDMNNLVYKYIHDDVCENSVPFFPGDFTIHTLASYMGIDENTVYMGDNYTIHGIPVSRWQRCTQTNNNVFFTLDFYFTSDDWISSNRMREVPIRIEMKGITERNNKQVKIHHIYDYLKISPLDESQKAHIFDMPLGVFCPGDKLQTLPKFPPNIFFREEITQKGKTIVAEVFIDSDADVMRVDERDLPYYSIYDFQSRNEYMVFKQFDHCGRQLFNRLPQYLNAGAGNTQAVSLKRFLYSDTNTTFDGQRTIRGLKCDMFSQKSAGGYISLCFLKVSGKSRQLIYVQKTPLKGDIMTSQIYDFRPMQDPPFGIFDIRKCFTVSAISRAIDLTIVLENKYLYRANPGTFRRELLAHMVTRKIASLIGMPLLRLQWKEVTYSHQVANLVISFFPGLYTYYPFEEIPNTDRSSNATTLLQGKTVVDCERLCKQSIGSNNRFSFRCVDFSYDRSRNLCKFFSRSSRSDLVSRPNVDYYRPKPETYSPSISIQQARKLLEEKVSQGLVQVEVAKTLFLATNIVTLDDKLADKIRNPALKDYKEFSMRRRRSIHYFQVLTGLTLYDCAKACTEKKTHTCHAIKYSAMKAQCQLSEDRLSDDPYYVKSPISPKSLYRIFERSYSADFKKYPGITVLSASDATYLRVQDVEACAHMCVTHNDFTCLSFDFCSDSGGVCALGKQHFTEVAQEDLTDKPGCQHYSRNFIDDFEVTTKIVTKFKISTVVQDINSGDCASKCSLEVKSGCSEFHFCPLTATCAYFDPQMPQITQPNFLGKESDCDTYSRKRGLSNYKQRAHQRLATVNSEGRTSDNNNNNGNSYTSGQMAGLGLGALILGFLVVAIALYTFVRLRQSRGDDTRAFNMSKLQEGAEN